MQIHSENTQEFIQALAASIEKDPSSLENWRCLHISTSKEISFDLVEKTLRQLKVLHKEYDCDVVHCEDNDMFFISRNLNDAQLSEIADELDIFITSSPQAGNPSEFKLYNIYFDWRIVRALMLTKTSGSKLTLVKPSEHNFGEIASLQEVFSEAKQLRKARMPLHVMVVEDDLLTRRLVTGAFKENYALITAETAQEAVMNYMLHAPDVVFLDIGLPDASGFDVLHQILESDPDAYVVMFSGNSYLDNVTNALSNGASGFISKPFKKEKMRQYIQDSAMHHRKSYA